MGEARVDGSSRALLSEVASSDVSQPEHVWIGTAGRQSRRRSHPMAPPTQPLRDDGPRRMPLVQASRSSTQLVKPWLASNTNAEMYVPSPTKKVSRVGCGASLDAGWSKSNVMSTPAPFTPSPA